MSTVAALIAAVLAAGCAPVPAPVPAQPRSHAEAWAVVVGAAHPGGARTPPRKHAVADAEAVYTLLTTTAGLKKDNVVLLTDRSERKPTLRNIKFALGTFLGRSATRDDTVVIYMAGQGALAADSRGAARDGLARYFLPSDADPDDLHQTALPLDELQLVFDRIEAERVVLFLDFNYSGAAGGVTIASKKGRGGDANETFLRSVTASRGLAIVSASRPNELALEAPDLGHGIFTYYLVEGLKGAADLNRDGIVTLQELYEYVEQQAGRKSRAIGGNQHPTLKGQLEGVLPLVKVPRP